MTLPEFTRLLNRRPDLVPSGFWFVNDRGRIELDPIDIRVERP